MAEMGQRLSRNRTAPLGVSGPGDPGREEWELGRVSEDTGTISHGREMRVIGPPKVLFEYLGLFRAGRDPDARGYLRCGTDDLGSGSSASLTLKAREGDSPACRAV